ncbi:MAG: helix-turn-helix domain-containing protein [Bauldia sp.]|nr:helix-turn-helix domain-containing protein [Bauldia sp.]
MDRRTVAQRHRRGVAVATPKGGRRHALGSIRPTATYSVGQITLLLRVHPNTVRGWIRDGLPVIDGEYPTLIHGSALVSFLRDLKARQKRACGPGEFYCFGCHAPQAPATGSVKFVPRNAKQLMITATCPVCGTLLNRAGAVQRLHEYEAIFGTPERGEDTLNEREQRLSHCDSVGEPEDD